MGCIKLILIFFVVTNRDKRSLQRLSQRIRKYWEGKILYYEMGRKYRIRAVLGRRVVCIEKG
jgi:hypothetical protein